MSNSTACQTPIRVRITVKCPFGVEVNSTKILDWNSKINSENLCSSVIDSMQILNVFWKLLQYPGDVSGDFVRFLSF